MEDLRYVTENQHLTVDSLDCIPKTYDSFPQTLPDLCILIITWRWRAWVSRMQQAYLGLEKNGNRRSYTWNWGKIKEIAATWSKDEWRIWSSLPRSELRSTNLEYRPRQWKRRATSFPGNSNTRFYSRFHHTDDGSFKIGHSYFKYTDS